MVEKFFIITVDTEGDDLWSYKEGDTVKTHNAEFIPRFQKLCEKYGFQPVYLTNYEMILSDSFVEFIKSKAQQGLCEVGLHVHAWNNPPLFNLKRLYGGNPYLIEYPTDIMREKVVTTYNLIKDKIGLPPISHRAGRWAMNTDYFNILEKLGIRVDCSYTPTISWKGNCGQTVLCGIDYSHVKPFAHWIGDVLEVPVTIQKRRWVFSGTLRQTLRNIVKGKSIWLRPASSNIDEMCSALNEVKTDKRLDYAEFMIHSSELMPGGSPYFKTEQDIENLYNTMENLFSYASLNGFVGCTLKGYWNQKKK